MDQPATAPSPDQLKEFYEDAYAPRPGGDQYTHWRQLAAETKADHVVRLLATAPLARRVSLLEVGCGDGAVLQELGRRGIARQRFGVDISSAAVGFAAQRPYVTAARVFDGERIDAQDRTYDLVLATHVLEHVPDPQRLLAELARVARTVIVEVPLERNLSARRPAARSLSEGSGHLHHFTRGQIRRMIAATGWVVRSELLDPLPLAVHTFWARTERERARGYAKWAIRRAIAGFPAVREHLITLHYAALALPGET